MPELPSWAIGVVGVIIGLVVLGLVGSSLNKATNDVANSANVLVTTTNQSLGLADGSGTSMLNREINLNLSAPTSTCLNVLSLKVSNATAPAAVGNNTLHSGNWTITDDGKFTLTNDVFQEGQLNLSYTSNNAAACAAKDSEQGVGNLSSYAGLIGTVVAVGMVLAVFFVLVVFALRRNY